MKLVITVIHDRDKHRISDALVKSNFKFTKLASTGGFLRDGNITFLIGVEEKRLDELLSVIQESCKTREQYANFIPGDAGPIGVFIPSPVKVLVGGAVVFVVDVERFERF
ncbi:MAG: cyclic-di-AMP receptor [Armatimonadota bacterium]